MYNRIAIIGISSTGKSTLARLLSKQTDIPVFHMDQFIWKENWEEVPQEDFRMAYHQVLQKEKWIIEGYLYPDDISRLELADIVIYLDYSGWRAAYQGFKRWWTYRNKERPEMAKGCVETFDLNFLITMFKRRERFEIEALLTNIEIEKVIRLNNPMETRILIQLMGAFHR